MSKQDKLTGQAPVFSASSPGFLYSVIVAALTIFAAAGVSFPASPGEVSGEIVTLLSTGGFYAILGVLAASVAFPLWNAYQKGALSFHGVFSSSLTWVAIVVAIFSGLALVGLDFPDGTAEQLVYAVFAKDWVALAGVFFNAVLPTVVRFIKK
jgi:hypothetical protein